MEDLDQYNVDAENDIWVDFDYHENTSANRIILIILFFSIALSSNASVYIVGSFNNWDISHPLELTEKDGIYSATIDFSKGDSFKMSLDYPSGNSTDERWTSFDKNTLSFDGNATIDQWIDLRLQPQSWNLHAPASETLIVSVNIDAMTLRFTRKQYAETPYSGTLPVLFINTDGLRPITSKEEYIQASYWLDPMDCDIIEAIGSMDVPLTMQIRGRGNYTWTGFNKKPYRLKLDKKQPMLGMPSSKHWALLAHADDNLGMLRNVAGFSASRALDMPWTPDSQPCEVMLNGDYIGLYFLTETIRVDKNRVNITVQEDEAVEDVDGGWLVEIDNYSNDPHVTVYENGDNRNPVWFTYKSPEVLSSQQSSYLTSAMKNIDNAIYSSSKDKSLLENMVDLDILARYYIVQELLDDTESFHGSCFLYRDRGEECRWMFGPVWDFGNAYHRDDYRQFIWQNPAFRQVWIGEIYKFDYFQRIVRQIWAEFLNKGDVEITSTVEEMADKISVAAEYDYRRWPSYGTDRELSKCKDILTKLNDKIAWLKTQWGSTPSSIEASEFEITEIPVEYYNLQGIKLSNPVKGEPAICRRGTYSRIIIR